MNIKFLEKIIRDICNKHGVDVYLGMEEGNDIIEIKLYNTFALREAKSYSGRLSFTECTKHTASVLTNEIEELLIKEVL